MEVKNVVRMEANDGIVFLKKTEPGWVDEVLKSCSSNDLRYAAGFVDNETHDVIINKLKDKTAIKNRFASCIFTAEPPDTHDKQGRNLAGLGYGELYNGTLWIKIFIIIPRYRRQGIGRRAAGLVFKQGKELCGASEAMLSVAGMNRAGIRFWIGQGFTEACSIYRPLFGDGQLHRVLILRKKL
jgi:ribosomal protein S18 acetylase RimI-like enzyme